MHHSASSRSFKLQRGAANGGWQAAASVKIVVVAVVMMKERLWEIFR